MSSGVDNGEVYVIISGGTVDPLSLKEVLDRYVDGAVVVAVDKGLEVCSRTGITPDVIVGDFDSANSMIVKKYQTMARLRGTSIVGLNVHKDFTDTHAAVRYAAEHGARTIYMLGATGTRFDHTYANVGLLKRCADMGICAYIVDTHNIITMINKSSDIPSIEGFDYISFLPYGGAASGVTLTGFEYPAEDMTFEMGDSIGVSNTITADNAHADISDGYLIVNYSRD